MSTQMMLGLFDVKVERVYTDLSRDFEHKTKEQWKQLGAERRCADCRRLLKSCRNIRSCGGARAEGGFDLCDDCAVIDDNPDGGNRWGFQLTPDERGALVELQRQRRAKNGDSS